MLKIEEKIGDSNLEYRLIGNLDESAELVLADFLSSFSKSEIILNCRDIQQINSVGVRIWIQFLKKLTSTTKISVSECCEVFMDYRALIPAMTQNSEILSVVVGFECRNCGSVIDKIINRADFKIDLNFGTLPCTTCSHAAIPIANAEDLFSFLEE